MRAGDYPTTYKHYKSPMRNKIATFLWLYFAMTAAMQASTPAMKSYTIDLPDYVLHFTLPEEMAKDIPPWKLVQRFDSTDSSYLSNGFLEIVAGYHEFKGPFWVGAYGSLEFGFSVQKPLPEYQGEITTLDGLGCYIQWWTNKTNPTYGFKFDKGALNGTTWVRRWVNTFGSPLGSNLSELHEQEILSQPLNHEMFLEAYFNITESVAGSAKKWKQKADELRDAIKATIVLEPKK
jgi:hypothetical protein